MIKLDENFLKELGLDGLPQEERRSMLNHIYETLEMRVGVKLASGMSDDQLNEFEAYVNNKDESGALKWLESNFPDYKKVVEQELEKLKSEIKEAAPKIIEETKGSS